MASCPHCGAGVAPADRFCPACGGALASDTAAARPGAGLAGPRSLARIAQIVALLGFVLPWITVSCQGRVLAEVSGLDLALGRVTVRNPFTEVAQVHSGSPNTAVVLALVLILAGLALSLNVRARSSAAANAGASVVALLLVGYEVLVSAGAAVRERTASTHMPAGDFERSLSEAVKMSTGFGFWLTCLALAAAAFLYWTLWTARDPPPPRGG